MAILDAIKSQATRPGLRAELLTLGVGLLMLLVLTGAVLKLPVVAQFALVAGLSATLASIVRPALMITAWFLLRILMDLLWWVPGSVFSLNLMELYTGGITVLALGLIALRARQLQDHPCLPPFIAYCLVLVIGGVRNLEVRSAAEILARYLSPFVLMFAVSLLLDSRSKRRRFVIGATAVGLVPIAISLYHLARGQMATINIQGYHRLVGGYMNVHPHALMMMILGSLGVWWVLVEPDSRRRLLMLGYTGAAALCLYLTYVRTGLVSFVLVSSALMWITGRRRELSALVLVGVVFVIATPAMQDRFKDVLLFFFPNDDVLVRRKIGSGRIGIWTAAIGEYLRHPASDILLGLGIGKHWLLTRAATNPYAPAKDGFIDTHNDYLTMTFQVGPVAMLSYIAMQFWVVRASWAVFQRSPDRFSRSFAAYSMALMIGATAANLLSNAFINRITQSWVLWGFAGVTFAEYLQLQREGLAPMQGLAGTLGRVRSLALGPPPSPALPRTRPPR